ncbi:MAG: glycosyltransferase family 2 protein [Actinomycetota bacterium]|nr:glycosyltransferase family 2 protein [Actinomycetota bacterium]
MKFSVIIVNYASWPLTVRCVGSFYRTNYEDFEVVVVDNDRSEPPPLPSTVRVIRNPKNVGFAKACNQGIAASKGDLLVLINPDTVVSADFFERMGEFFERDYSIGVAGPRVLDPGGSLQLSARKELSMVSGLLGRTSFLTRLFPKSSLVKSQFPSVTESTYPTPVDWVSGACMVVRRQTLNEVGPLDERFFMYFEDADLCRRVREAGWSVYYLPEVVVVHRAGGSTQSRPRAIWNLHKSAFLYHRKHGAHGPLNLYSLLVLLGLTGRALAKLAGSSARVVRGRIVAGA